MRAASVQAEKKKKSQFRPSEQIKAGNSGGGSNRRRRRVLSLVSVARARVLITRIGEYGCSAAAAAAAALGWIAPPCVAPRFLRERGRCCGQADGEGREGGGTRELMPMIRPGAESVTYLTCHLPVTFQQFACIWPHLRLVLFFLHVYFYVLCEVGAAHAIVGKPIRLSEVTQRLCVLCR